MADKRSADAAAAATQEPAVAQPEARDVRYAPERPTPPPYSPVRSGQSAAEAVAAAEAAAQEQAAAYRAATRVTPAPSFLQFTPFPDLMPKIQQMLNPTRAPPRTTTPDPGI